MSEAIPGSFRDDRIEPNPNWGDSGDSKIEATFTLDSQESLVKCYGVYQKHFGEPKNIIYPACGGDISLRTAFPSPYITFVDPNVGYTTAIREQVSNAIVHCMNFEDYTGRGFDLGVIFNAWCRHDILPSHIKTGGHILSNGGWNFDAESYFTHPKTRLMGVFLRTEDGGLIFSQEDMESYLKKTGESEPGKRNYEKTASFYLFEIIA